MNDRELLELAAKAAGVKIDKSPCNGGGIGNTGFDLAGNAVIDRHNGTVWNPLTDDGDALRLAVKLGISVMPGVFACKVSHIRGIPNGIEIIEENRGDGLGRNTESGALQAARRAIVRAAVEIAKQA
ncbi:hypothetical protein [Chromobacterium rhizoryzae]|uniref:Uncharacterized protein n=1 Tax=Chromobacterium rhizoryzae TaxID=1778675 RepID=A0AAD0RPK8_9NEIS|nr:hypothetical protein [Chromobacterium rhizoryzae]AXT46367.1 hypothetical protein D1345_09285 [Chromobacterium rhizoryzae]